MVKKYMAKYFFIFSEELTKGFKRRIFFLKFIFDPSTY